MKKTLLFIYLTFLLSFSISAQEIPVALIDRANNSEYIFEGVVLETNSYKSENDIYTSNTIQITKILKGSVECGEIEIITAGGSFENRSSSLSHSLELKEGDMGIFLCNNTNRPISIIDFNEENNSQILEGHFENQSFIRYWWNGSELRASDIVFDYQNLINVYNLAELITGFSFSNCSLDSPIQEYIDDMENINNNKSAILPPSITSFSPDSAAAGVENLVTIYGENFGNQSSGEVRLRNVENNSAIEYIKINDESIQNWSDTEISFFVPSKLTAHDALGLSKTTVGSGRIKVKTNQGIDSTDDILTIPYSVHNYKHYQVQSGITYIRPIERGVIAPIFEDNRTFIFHCDPQVTAKDNGDMKKVIKKALNYWRCVTGINWIIGDDTSISGIDTSLTTISKISLGPLNAPKLAVTKTHLSHEGMLTSSGTDTLHYTILPESDIIINSLITNWNYDTTSSILFTGRDFYSTILHELGHAMGVGHVMQEDQIMTLTVTQPGQLRRINLQNDESCNLAGNDIVQYSVEPSNLIISNPTPNYYNIEADPNPPCQTLSISNISTQDVNNIISTYPNPCQDIINIDISENFDNGLITIVNTSGKIIFNKNVVEKNFSIETSFLETGTYFFHIILDNENKYSSKIVKE